MITHHFFLNVVSSDTFFRNYFIYSSYAPCIIVLLPHALLGHFVPHALSGRVGQTGFADSGGEWSINKKKEIQMNEFPFFLKRCLAESNRSTRFCRPLPNRSVKTPCVEQSFLICECKGTTFYWFYQIFMQLF